MTPTLPEIAEALKVAEISTSVRHTVGIKCFVSCSWQEWLPERENPLIESAARSAVLKVAPGSFARPALPEENEGKVLVVFLDENHHPIERPEPVYYARAATYTAAWLHALVSLNKAGLLK